MKILQLTQTASKSIGHTMEGLRLAANSFKLFIKPPQTNFKKAALASLYAKPL